MLTKKRKSTLLTLSILMGLTSCTQASEVIQTPDVVVTATKTQQEVKAVPNAVEVITSEDIEQLGATDIYSALKLAINVDVSQIGAGHRLMVRGKNAGALVLLDGRRMSNEYSSMTRGAFDLDKINLSSVERIEIVRGAASAQYGADAESGVINIITKKSKEQSVTVGANTGTDVMNNYYRFDLGQQGKFNGVVNANFAKYRKREFVGGTGTNYFGPRTNYDFSGTYAFDYCEPHTCDLNHELGKQNSQRI
ncbi:MAG: TonB-dependent receptor plug domain-containing protein [Megamonas funiformis]|uniref:TonB-dependent receptor plug domain-containing protein n=1 Tax=Megamonas funiformis TaxID=437897 RepID=UPI002A7ED876|nr:TonB-dependent receptor plug domain-containing protein [Megamonas funiformis]MDY3875537.1 TonB-dependent receptor plug domain-containing protein [Megamonas funiformis]